MPPTRRRHPHLLVLAVVCLVSTALGAQQALLPEPVRAAADRITAAQLEQDLAYFASDDLLGRNTPSPGFDLAADSIIRRLERAGVKPFGDNGTFRQHYEMHETRIDTAQAYLEIGGRRFAFGEGFALRSFAGPIAGALPIVYVGHGWTVPGKGIDPYAGLDVRGKLLLVHGPGALPKDADVKMIGRVSVGGETAFAEAERRGAAGILFITRERDLARWDTLRTANTVRRELEPRVPSAYAALPVTSALLAPEAIDTLFEGERMSGPDMRKLGETADYAPSFELKTSATLHVPVASTTVHRPYNVVALIEGSDPTLKHEYITLEAHLDGAVGTREVDGDLIYNSADDNASGSAALLAIAEQMMTAPRPKRSQILIWDSGEEQGLWGTRWFVHAPPAPLAQIVAHFNVDMIGASRRPGSADEASKDVTEPGEVFVIGPGVLSAQVDALLERVNAEYLKLRFNRAHDRADSEFLYPRTDAGPFLERGILTIGFTTGIHDRYHLPADEAHHLDPKQIEGIARTVFVSAWALADADERPRIEGPLPPSVLRVP
jgi:Zn-dependent M28 family amino/carboxypeptidase